MHGHVGAARAPLVDGPPLLFHLNWKKESAIISLAELENVSGQIYKYFGKYSRSRVLTLFVFIQFSFI